jgi:DtxR family Mn-dependent transcriptional regulator
MRNKKRRAHHGKPCPGRTVGEKKIDELLELIWILREEGQPKLEELLKLQEIDNPRQAVEEMIDRGLIELVDNDQVRLRKPGEERAKEITRRHRLAERLLSEIFLIEEKDMESSACEFEHILSPDVTERICTFLGHPPTCPHGKPIPPGECCAKFRTEVKPLVVPLANLGVGRSARITFISPRYAARLDKLGSLGVLPGNLIKLRQTRPSYVVEVDETTVALEKEIAEEIFVKEQ